MLTSLTLLYQKGVLLHEISHGANPERTKRVLPDIQKHNQPIIINLFEFNNNTKYILFNNTDDVEGVMSFDSDSVNLHVDSCVAGGLTRFRNDFIEDSHVNIPERSTDTTADKGKIIGEGIAAYNFNNNKGEPFTLHTKMAYAPQSKCRLISPQWIGI